MKTLLPGESVYLCLVTWPDGTEGLLFPRPGNVRLATDEEDGAIDLRTTIQHLKEYDGWLASEKSSGSVIRGLSMAGTKIRLLRFECLEVLDEYVHGA